MKASLRRIANALLLMSVLTLSATTVGTVLGQCSSEGSSCLATLVFGYGPLSTITALDNTTAVSTVAVGTDPLSGFVVQIAQLVSLYGLVIAVAVLLALECVELYYIRKAIRMVRLRSA